MILVEWVPVRCPRVLIKHDNADSFLNNTNDKIFLQCYIDEGLQLIIKKLDWAEQFHKIAQVEKENA